MSWIQKRLPVGTHDNKFLSMRTENFSRSKATRDISHVPERRIVVRFMRFTSGSQSARSRASL